MLRRPIVRLGVLLAFILAPAIARAQSAGDAAAAQAHFQRGVALGQRGQWRDAIAEFETARSLGPTAPVQYNLGVAYRAVRGYARAVEAFEAFLARAGGEADPAQLASVRAMIASMRRELGSLAVRTDPPSTSLAVDGVAVDPRGAARSVDPGRHVVRAGAAGFYPLVRAVVVHPGQAYEIDAALARVDDGARLHVESNVSGATIRFDGAALGTSAVEEFVRPGAHRIDVTAPGYAAFHRDVVLVARGSERVRAVLADRRTVFASPWLWTLVGVVATGAIVAGIVVAAEPHEPLFRGPLENIMVPAMSP